jgi:2-oxoglutarate dehydrogenase E1 component
VLWEAQFGDFANGAQVVIDQFIVVGRDASGCACRAWSCCCRTAMRARARSIPRPGSSAILQLCAEDNMQVGNCTTPANYFHVAAPPDQARLPQAAGRDDAEVAAAPQARRSRRSAKWRRAPSSTACSGTMRRCAGDAIKLKPTTRSVASCCARARSTTTCYEEREKRGLDDVYLLRVEQLYPVPGEVAGPPSWRASRTPNVVWCQEEPQNMGAWSFVEPLISKGARRTPKAKAKRAGAMRAARLRPRPATGLDAAASRQQEAREPSLERRARARPEPAHWRRQDRHG